MKINDKYVTVIGVRITTGSYKYPEEVDKEMKDRSEQMDFILERIKKIQKDGSLIVCAGDFNTGRIKNKNKYWNFEILERKLSTLNIHLYKPQGYSHELFKGAYAGRPDYIFTSNEMLTIVEPYDWGFTINEVYNEYKDEKGDFNSTIDSPYPDHGIIVADIDVKSQY